MVHYYCYMESRLSSGVSLCLVLLLVLLLLVSAPVLAQSPSPSLSTIPLTISTDYTTQFAMGDMQIAYQLVSPSLQLTLQYALSQASVTAVAELTIDAGVVSEGLTIIESEVYPTLALFPCISAAIVPIYRLDSLGIGGEAPTLIFSRSALADIYTGSITYWDDAALRVTNPTLTLPHQPIIVITQNETASINTIFSTALIKFDSSVLNYTNSSAAPSWPYNRYHNFMGATGATGVAAAVVSNDGSIGYAVLAAALQTAANVGQMINKAGRAVTANSDSVQFAAIELGSVTTTSSTSNSLISTLDLTDGNSASVWPISIVSYFLLDLIHTDTTCAAREALVNFMLWIYQSEVAASLLATRQYAVIPTIVLQQLNTIDGITTGVMCRGSPALPVVESPIRILSGTVHTTFVSNLLINFYEDSTADRWAYEENTSQLVMEQMISAEVDVAMFNPTEVNADTYQALVDSQEYLILPMALTALTWTYNPQISATINLANYANQVVMDMNVIGLIYWSCIMYWNHSAILALNPWLVPILANVTDLPMIQQVSGCGSDSTSIENFPLSNALLDFVYAFTPPNSTLATCENDYPLTLWASYYDCQAQPAWGISYAPSEQTIAALVLGKIGGMGPTQAVLDPQYGRPIVPVNGYPTFSNVADMSACTTDTWDASTLSFNVSASQNPACYPMTQMIVAVVRTNYSNSMTSTGNCARGQDALEFMSWLVSTTAIDLVMNANNIVRIPSLNSDYATAYMNALNAVTCDGVTMLITLPTKETPSNGIIYFGLVAMSLGMVTALITLTYSLYHRHHSIIRSASPAFLCTSLIGILLLFISGIFLMLPASNWSCSTFNFILNTGFMWTFAPLFAKTYRIYRIFGGKKLAVVKMSNKKLAILTTSLCVLDLILLIIWQSISPMAAYSTLTTDNANNIYVEYIQCGVRDAGVTLFIIVCIEKGALLVFGALMAFTTRRVASTFNESSGIALAIYNVVFSLALIATIIEVINAIGDVLLILEIFVLLWIAFFTLGLLFLPKFLLIINKETNTVQNVSHSYTISSDSGYSFLSLTAFSNVASLVHYLNALKVHLQHAEQRLIELRKKGMSVGSSAMYPSHLPTEKEKGSTIGGLVSGLHGGAGGTGVSMMNNNKSGLHNSNLSQQPRLQHRNSHQGSIIGNSSNNNQLNSSLSTSKEQTNNNNHNPITNHERQKSYGAGRYLAFFGSSHNNNAAVTPATNNTSSTSTPTNSTPTATTTGPGPLHRIKGYSSKYGNAGSIMMHDLNLDTPTSENQQTQPSALHQRLSQTMPLMGIPSSSETSSGVSNSNSNSNAALVMTPNTRSNPLQTPSNSKEEKDHQSSQTARGSGGASSGMLLSSEELKRQSSNAPLRSSGSVSMTRAGAIGDSIVETSILHASSSHATAASPFLTRLGSASTTLRTISSPPAAVREPHSVVHSSAPRPSLEEVTPTNGAINNK